MGTPTRPDLNSNLNLSGMRVRELLAADGRSLFRPLTAAHPTGVGNAGRNILRADGINRLDFGIIKNFRVSEGPMPHFNTTNTRDWGIPDPVVTSALPSANGRHAPWIACVGNTISLSIHS